MPQPLPPGWIDTGIRRTVTNSGSVKLRLDADPGTYVGFAGLSTPFILRDTSVLGACLLVPDPGVPTGVGYWECTLEGPGIIGAPIVLEHEAFGCRVGPWSRYSNVYSYSDVSGPFRLGELRESIVTDPFPVPEFWDNQRLRYAWFADENTTNLTQMAGYGPGLQYYQPGGGSAPWGAAQHPGMTPEAFPLPPLQWKFGTDGGNANAGDEFTIHAVFTALTADGATVDTSDLQRSWDTVMEGGGSGIVNCYHFPHPFTDEASEGAYPPHRFTYDLDITRFGNGSTGAHVLDTFVTDLQFYIDGSPLQPYALFLGMPYLANFLMQNVSWPTRKKRVLGPFRFDIEPVWAALERVPLETDDLQVPLYGSPPNFDPSSVTPYYPVRLHVIPSLDVLRPDGNQPSSFVTEDAAKCTVAEAGHSTAFHVIAQNGAAQRTFHNWRMRPSPTSEADYQHTKHLPGEDIWAWDTYAWQKQTWNASVATTAIMTVAGVFYQVEDDHNSPPTFDITEVPFAATYTIPLAAGSSTNWIRLTFPNEGGPYYLGRVDSVEMKFADPGDFTLSTWTLEARENAYLKLDFGPPVTRKDYSFLVLAQDGAFVLGNWPDQAYKPDETGDYGGGLRHVTPLTVLGQLADFTRSLQDAWTNLNLIEGIVATYSLADSDVGLKDAFGARMSPETAQDLQSVAPYVRLTPGTDYLPPVTPRVREMIIENGHPFKMLVRWPNWAALEAQVDSDGTQAAPAGIQCVAQRVDTGERAGAGTTDPSGFVIVTPVPANGSVEWKLVTL